MFWHYLQKLDLPCLQAIGSASASSCFHLAKVWSSEVEPSQRHCYWHWANLSFSSWLLYANSPWKHLGSPLLGLFHAVFMSSMSGPLQFLHHLDPGRLATGQSKGPHEVTPSEIRHLSAPTSWKNCPVVSCTLAFIFPHSNSKEVEVKQSPAQLRAKRKGSPVLCAHLPVPAPFHFFVSKWSKTWGQMISHFLWFLAWL